MPGLPYFLERPKALLERPRGTSLLEAARNRCLADGNPGEGTGLQFLPEARL